jgi:hypothetical protein
MSVARMERSATRVSYRADSLSGFRFAAPRLQSQVCGYARSAANMASM